MPQLTLTPRRPGPPVRMALIAAILAGLAACTGSRIAQPLRPPGDPIYSNASFDLSRLTGTWVQVAGFAAEPRCAGGRVIFSKDGSGATTGDARICVAGRLQGWSGAVTPVGPGRFIIGGGEAWWVLWDDADNRTLVIGTPSGAFGFVLDRTGDLPADRLAAAREILDFNGYDLARLRTE